MSLNAAQTAAVETLSGPLLVLAGAGTGKTRVVTYRIARLIKSGVAPDRILAVTFTNKAAREMQERISSLLPKRVDKKKPEISTFHSLCVRILRRQIHRLGFPTQFSIYDRGDQESLARQILREVKITSAALRPADFLKAVGDWKTAGVRPEKALEIATDSKDYLCAVAYSKYQARLKNLGAVDFDDILLLTEDLFRLYPDALEEEAARFDHLLVDEYQDTNMCQYRVVKGLAMRRRNLCVVGDDDQAIYGWRGAEVKHILNFQRDWPEAKVVRLEENYRSTAQILRWANTLVAFNSTRHEKRLRSNVQGDPPRILQCKDAEEEAKRVALSIKVRMEETRRRPRDFAILFRTNEQTRAVEMELRSAKIPYVVVGGQSFFDRKEVKDVVSYLKAILRPQDDVALLRTINAPPRGIGSTTIGKIRERAVAEGKPIWEIATKDDAFMETLDSRSREATRRYCELIVEEGRRLKRDFTPETLTKFLEAVKYQEEIDRLYPDEAERKARTDSVGEVVDAAAAFLKENPGGSLAAFLDEAALGGPDFSSQQDKKSKSDAVLLSTYHAAKGLEFKEVYMVGMEEGILPHQRSIETLTETAIEEERRLCYVGVTRAQIRLTLTMALARTKWGKARPTIPSRFLYELTGQSDNPRYLAAKEGRRPNETRKPPTRRRD